MYSDVYMYIWRHTDRHWDIYTIIYIYTDKARIGVLFLRDLSYTWWSFVGKSLTWTRVGLRFFSMVPAFQHVSTNCEASKLSKKKCLDDFPMFFLWFSYDFMIFKKVFNCLTIVSPMIFRCPVQLQLRIHPSHQGKGTTLQKRKRTQSSCGKLGVYINGGSPKNG